MTLKSPFLLAVMGPTASGKTALAEQIAAELGAGLLNADAFQIYKGMDIGTSKPTQKHLYDLIDIKNPSEDYGVGEWAKAAQDLLEKAFQTNKSYVVVGGTGFYIRALMEEYKDMLPKPDPELREEIARREREEGLETLVKELLTKNPEIRNTVDLNNPMRVKRALERFAYQGQEIRVSLPPFQKIKLGLQVDKDTLESAITQRTSEMVQNGWVQEVRDLVAQGYGHDDPGFRAIGYKTILRHVCDEIDLNEAIEKTVIETRQYAKRQRTWLRSEPGLTTVTHGAPAKRFEQAMQWIKEKTLNEQGY